MHKYFIILTTVVNTTEQFYFECWCRLNKVIIIIIKIRKNMFTTCTDYLRSLNKVIIKIRKNIYTTYMDYLQSLNKVIIKIRKNIYTTYMDYLQSLNKVIIKIRKNMYTICMDYLRTLTWNVAYPWPWPQCRSSCPWGWVADWTVSHGCHLLVSAEWPLCTPGQCPAPVSRTFWTGQGSGLYSKTIILIYNDF